MREENLFFKKTRSRLDSEQGQFLFPDMTLEEYLAVGLVRTASSWVRRIVQDTPQPGERKYLLVGRFAGHRISELVSDTISRGWKNPTITELVSFATDHPDHGAPIVALTPQDVGGGADTEWVPVMVGDLLEMWPTSHILPTGASVLYVQ